MCEVYISGFREGGETRACPYVCDVSMQLCKNLVVAFPQFLAFLCLALHLPCQELHLPLHLESEPAEKGDHQAPN